MKFKSSVALAVALMVLPSSVALAQAGGRGGMRGMYGMNGGLQMLRLPEVQKELNLTPAQIALVDAKQQEIRDALRALYPGGFGQMTSEQRKERNDKQQELSDKAAAEILMLRYHQLELQQQGPIALTRKSVADQLKLTEDQQKKIVDLQTQADTDRRAAMQGVDFRNMSDADRQTLMTKMSDIQKAEGDKILALLTDTQKADWKTLQGTPFTFPTAGPTPPAAPAVKP